MIYITNGIHQPMTNILHQFKQTCQICIIWNSIYKTVKFESLIVTKLYIRVGLENLGNDMSDKWVGENGLHWRMHNDRQPEYPPVAITTARKLWTGVDDNW